MNDMHERYKLKAIKLTTRRMLNPGDLFVYLEVPRRRAMGPGIGQLAYVRGGVNQEPPPDLGALPSPQKPGGWLHQLTLDAAVLKLDFEESGPYPVPF